MNSVSRQESRVVTRQVPVLLLVVTGLFSLPLLAFSLVMILGGKDADGKYFCLLLGLFILWVSLEFIATRERIVVDQTTEVLTRTVSGVFRYRRQTVDLGDIINISLESMMQSVGTKNLRRLQLYMNGRHGKVLLNSPAKVNLDHREAGRILHEATQLPYRELYDGREVGNVVLPSSQE